MIKALRKRHRQIWLAWAILIPAGIVFAWLAIPNQPAVRLLKENSPLHLPEVVYSTDRADYLVSIRSDKTNKTWQLEWKNKTALTVPSAVIYRIQTAGTGSSGEMFDPIKAELLGRIEARGDYIFPIQIDSTGRSPLHLVLYDFIHEKIIDTINF